MTMNLHQRLRSLERAVGSGSNVCRACGNPRDGSLGQVVPHPIDLDNPCPPRDGPDTCAECGRRLVIRLLPITLGAAVYLWRRDRRARLPGHCPACGYDLAGLPPGGTCPECGSAAAPAV